MNNGCVGLDGITVGTRDIVYWKQLLMVVSMNIVREGQRARVTDANFVDFPEDTTVYLDETVLNYLREANISDNDLEDYYLATSDDKKRWTITHQGYSEFIPNELLGGMVTNQEGSLIIDGNNVTCTL